MGGAAAGGRSVCAGRSPGQNGRDAVARGGAHAPRPQPVHYGLAGYVAVAGGPAARKPQPYPAASSLPPPSAAWSRVSGMKTRNTTKPATAMAAST
uniref:Uncharacterized protein n=1 Tax=Tanacetum cinerariifolium TaxID=118510 RepID=A0A699SBX7_TANCI|nr:hypothetical protein [Tanacetum cinerariifolium]